MSHPGACCNCKATKDAELAAVKTESRGRLAVQNGLWGRVEAAEESLARAEKVIRFCAQWGGRSGRIPDPQPGSKVDHCRQWLAARAKETKNG